MQLRESVANSLTLFGACLTVCLDIVNPFFGGLWIAFTLTILIFLLALVLRAIPSVDRALRQDPNVEHHNFVHELLSKYWPTAVIGSTFATSIFLGGAIFLQNNMEESGSVTIVAIEKLLDKYHQEQMEVLQTVKKETSDNPAKELANRGVSWGKESFSAALQEPNFENARLFLEGSTPALSLYEGENQFCSFITKLSEVQAMQIVDVLVDRGVDLDKKLNGYGWAEEYLLLCALMSERAELSKKIVASGAKASTVTRYVLDADFRNHTKDPLAPPTKELSIWRNLVQSKSLVHREIVLLLQETEKKLNELEDRRTTCIEKNTERAKAECSQPKLTIRYRDYIDLELKVLRKCKREKSAAIADCYSYKSNKDLAGQCVEAVHDPYSVCMNEGKAALQRFYSRPPSSNEMEACISEDSRLSRCTERHSYYSDDENTLRAYVSYLEGIKQSI